VAVCFGEPPLLFLVLVAVATDRQLCEGEAKGAGGMEEFSGATRGNAKGPGLNAKAQRVWAPLVSPQSAHHLGATGRERRMENLTREKIREDEINAPVTWLCVDCGANTAPRHENQG